MAKTITVNTLTEVLEGTSYTATGTCNGVQFVARTIMYRGEPIFKVQETNDDGELSHLRMKDSQFNRGDRIAIARRLRAVRLGESPLDVTDDLDNMSVKELRARCKELGLRGYHAKGVRKDDLVAKLRAA
jgi:hypothetical protein